MSRETMQFVEMVREADGRLKAMAGEGQDSGEADVGGYCEICGKKGMRYVRDVGLDEVYECRFCGMMKFYRVR